mmetsp:Transcript_4536/g.12800  ORF Transcript_4536/g.12800 Transcript_4536/m.12800 type:complete len:202 (-) Transcript_4536:1256-1861(-)
MPWASNNCCFISSDISIGISVTRHSVVSTSPATLAEFSMALMVTLAGSSTPLSIRSQNSILFASHPQPKPFSAAKDWTLARITAPSIPAFSATCMHGADMALMRILAPCLSSSLSIAAIIVSAISFWRVARQAPPPGTTPSSRALSTEFRASSYRSFLSLSSVSVAAPTLIRAIPPPRAATRSVAFSLSKSVSAVSASRRI